MDDSLLLDALSFYLRQAKRLECAGLEPLSQQPSLAEALLWDYACLAAERLARFRREAGLRTQLLQP